MKIKEVRAVEIELNPKPTTPPRTPSRAGTFPMNRPDSRYPRAREKRETYLQLGLETARLYCNSRRWYMGIRYLALQWSRDQYYQRSLRSASHRRKLHSN